jgi:hypothetical protein
LIVAANHISFAIQEERIEENVRPDNFLYFMLGSCAAIVAGGIYNDTLFDRRAYLTIAGLNMLGIGWQTFFLLPFFESEEDNSFYYTILGFTTTITEFFIRILIPLYFATKNRITYELTMAGTLVATVNLMFFFTGKMAT